MIRAKRKAANKVSSVSAKKFDELCATVEAGFRDTQNQQSETTKQNAVMNTRLEYVIQSVDAIKGVVEGQHGNGELSSRLSRAEDRVARHEKILWSLVAGIITVLFGLASLSSVLFKKP